MGEKAFYAVILSIVVIGGIGIGVSYYHAVSPTPEKATTTITGPYHLDLVEIMDASFNQSAGAQPIFYVINNGTLESTANIRLPSHTEIVVTITSYDMGNASVPKEFLKATGLVGNKVLAINSTIAMGDNTSQKWEMTLTSFPASQVLHTFTILNGSSVLVNIPVMPGYTEIAQFYLNSTGSFTWQCEAACGTGPSGWGGPMATAGWMTGTVTVY